MSSMEQLGKYNIWRQLECPQKGLKSPMPASIKNNNPALFILFIFLELKED